jgi:hypothetical protein
LAAAAAVYLSDDCPHKSRRLAGEIFHRAQSRIIQETKRSFDYMNQAQGQSIHRDYRDAVNFIEQTCMRESATLESMKSYSRRDDSVDRYVDVLITEIKGWKEKSFEDLRKYYKLSCEARETEPQKIALTEEEIEARKLRPIRNPALKGPLGWGYLRDKLASTDIDFFRLLPGFDSRMTYEILNCIDGERNVLDIRNAVSAEYEPVPVSKVLEFIELLAKADVVQFSN